MLDSRACYADARMTEKGFASAISDDEMRLAPSFNICLFILLFYNLFCLPAHLQTLAQNDGGGVHQGEKEKQDDNRRCRPFGKTRFRTVRPQKDLHR